MRLVLLILSVCLIAVSIPAVARAQATRTERIATGIDRPVFAVSPPGDANRLFIVEQQTGRIEIMDLNTNTISATPFLTLGGLSTGNEQGLLGLAFDPNYATNGYFYVNLTTSADGGDTHIRRYQVQGDPITSNVANAASQFEILSFDQPQDNHNGGWIDFGPNDGYLYISTGDGGGGNDSGTGHTSGSGNAQDTTNNFLGKMLRIDVAGDDFPGDSARNYAIPASNPFVGVTGDDEIWAFGLRNPFRSSFDRANGDLWIGDVGQGAREEIDFQSADSTGGENYGWRLREGTIATPSVGGNRPPGNVEPIYDYTRGSGTFQGNVVIGGYVYRGPVQEFQGHYIFADGGSHNIWKLDPDAVNPAASVTRINGSLTPNAGTIANIGSFGEDAKGNLYIMEVFGGELYRVTTSSQEIEWNGDDATAGTAGDGTTWGNSANWTRSATPDQSFVTSDHVLFVAGSSQETIELGATRVVSAATFEAPYTLTGSTLRVLSGNVTVDEGVTATIESTLEAESANHSLRKLGAGTLLVEGTANQTAVKEGTLGGTGTLNHLTVHDGGNVAPGISTGTLSVVNTFSMEAGATLTIEIGGTGVGEFDRLEIGGAAEVAGTLDVSLLSEFMPDAGDSFAFLFADGGYTGMFDTLNLPELASGLQWQLSPSGETLSLDVVVSVTPGDFDADGDVDGRDFLVWQRDAAVGDLADWQANYGAGSLSAAVSVPEPGAAIVISMAFVLALQTVRVLR